MPRVGRSEPTLACSWTKSLPATRARTVGDFEPVGLTPS
eukprot:SAG11_NODE_24386_length_374_cov_0.650909_1_plen_38_part_10